MQQLSLARWGFLFTEAVLIVASILLAFALDSWWDERKERVEEQEILNGLREEFLLNRSMLERRVAQHTKEQGELEILRAATESGRWAAGDLDLDAALAATITPPTTDLGNGVLEARLGFRYHTAGEYRTALEAVDDILAEIDRALSGN